jgi:hypothetical protein
MVGTGMDVGGEGNAATEACFEEGFHFDLRKDLAAATGDAEGEMKPESWFSNLLRSDFFAGFNTASVIGAGGTMVESLCDEFF